MKNIWWTDLATFWPHRVPGDIFLKMYHPREHTMIVYREHRNGEKCDFGIKFLAVWKVLPNKKTFWSIYVARISVGYGYAKKCSVIECGIEYHKRLAEKKALTLCSHMKVNNILRARSKPIFSSSSFINSLKKWLQQFMAKLSLDMVSQLKNGLCCIKHYSGVYEQNSTVNNWVFPKWLSLNSANSVNHDQIQE